MVEVVIVCWCFDVILDDPLKKLISQLVRNKSEIDGKLERQWYRGRHFKVVVVVVVIIIYIVVVYVAGIQGRVGSGVG